MNCYCCSKIPYHECCEPFITGSAMPDTAQKLMRSRFSAYCTAQYGYIVDTYAQGYKEQLTEEDIAQSAAGTRWFALDVIPHSAPDKVEFKAWYFDQRKVGLMHETSNFIVEAGRWKYTDGMMHDDTGYQKIGRNDPCPCASNKKFKQCCQRLLP